MGGGGGTCGDTAKTGRGHVALVQLGYMTTQFVDGFHLPAASATSLKEVTQVSVVFVGGPFVQFQ